MLLQQHTPETAATHPLFLPSHQRATSLSGTPLRRASSSCRVNSVISSCDGGQRAGDNRVDCACGKQRECQEQKRHCACSVPCPDLCLGDKEERCRQHALHYLGAQALWQ